MANENVKQINKQVTLVRVDPKAPTGKLRVAWYFEPEGGVEPYLEGREVKYREIRTGKPFDPYTYIPTTKQREEVINAEWGPNFFTLLEMNDYVKDYWGDNVDSDERLFTIPFWKADQLVLKSGENKKDEDNHGREKDTRALALLVRNIEDEKIMDAEWISFDNQNIPKGNGKETITIFVLDSYFFPPFVEGDKNPFRAFKGYIKRGPGEGDVPYNKLILTARIVSTQEKGKKEYGVVFFVGGIDFQIRPFTTTGPNGAGGGGGLP